MKKLLLMCLMIAAFAELRAQDSTTHKADFVAFQIATHNVYESKLIGFAATPSIQYKRFETMAAQADGNELVQIADAHANAVVRVYALKALLDKGVVLPPALEQKFRNDGSTIKTMNGCVINNQTVAQVARMLLSSRQGRANYLNG